MSPVVIPDPPYNHFFSCKNPENSDQDHLCAEREAADAAESQASWAALTFVIGLLGTSFVLVTLYYTRRAAEAAQEAAGIARRALTDIERPHVFPEIQPRISVEDIHGNAYPFVEFSLSNFGRLPADIIDCQVGGNHSRNPCDPGPVPSDPALRFVIGPDRTWKDIQIRMPFDMRFRFADLNDIGMPQRAFPVRADGDAFFRAVVKYRGVTAKEFVSDFVWYWDHGPNHWVPLYKTRT